MREGDVVEIAEKSRNHQMVLETLARPERDVPDYLSLDPKAFRVTVWPYSTRTIRASPALARCIPAVR